MNRSELLEEIKSKKAVVESLKEGVMKAEKELSELENLTQYPCVKAMKHFDKFQLVLFTAPRTGMNINGIGWPHGHMSDGWNEDSAEIFTGTIEYKDGLSIEGKRIYG